MNYSLPQAVIRFKQGFGRLIRSKVTGELYLFLIIVLREQHMDTISFTRFQKSRLFKNVFKYLTGLQRMVE